MFPPGIKEASPGETARWAVCGAAAPWLGRPKSVVCWACPRLRVHLVCQAIWAFPPAIATSRGGACILLGNALGLIHLVAQQPRAGLTQGRSLLGMPLRGRHLACPPIWVASRRGWACSIGGQAVAPPIEWLSSAWLGSLAGQPQERAQFGVSLACSATWAIHSPLPPQQVGHGF